jgi:Putative MetA-pathway of phenol degradation
MLRTSEIQFSLSVLLLIATTPLFAGPPYLTDDPDPVDTGHSEAIINSQLDYNHHTFNFNAPALDLNYGAISNVHLHLGAGMITSAPQHGASETGFGDLELGAKWRLLRETNWLPEIAIYPAVELPTGDASRGLGNGRVWFRLPLWLGKNFGEWSTYGGGGAVVNTAFGQRDYAYGGWQFQRSLGKRFTLGGEIFAQGRPDADNRSFVALNFGGTVLLNEHVSLIGSVGHTIAGGQHFLGYVGLDFTW